MNYTVTVAHDGFVPGTRLRYAAIVVDNYDRNTRRVNGRTLAETLKNPDLGKAVDNARFVEIVGKHYKVKGIFNPYAQAYVIIDVRVTSGGIKDDQIADDLGFEFANPAGRCPLEGSCRSMYSNGIDTILAVLDGQDMGWTDSVTKDVKAYKRFNIPSAFLSVRGFVIRDAEFRSVVSADEYAFVLEQIK